MLVGKLNRASITLLGFGFCTHSALAMTTCEGSNTPLSTTYLGTMTSTADAGSQSNNFVPSAYFLGKATKFVTSERGLTEIDDPSICVDGNTRTEIIQLFDDGTHGDDVAGDGVFSRACVHFCESSVDLNDIWGFGMENRDAAGAARLIVVDPALEGKIPSEVLPSPPQYPGATMIATSHAAFLVDSELNYFPEWPRNVNFAGGNSLIGPNGRSTAVGYMMSIFGDVFDFLTVSGLEENFQITGGVYKWQQWEKSGAPIPNERIGDAEACTSAVTGVPITRLVAVVGTEATLDSYIMNHEVVHIVAGYEYHTNMDERALKGDFQHPPDRCTVDSSYLQGPIWDWDKGFPIGLRMGYCDPSDDDCEPETGDLVRMIPNPECGACSEADLSDCCTFQLIDAFRTAKDMAERPELHTMSPLIKYIAGYLPLDQVPENEKTYYCLGTDDDHECGEDIGEKVCKLKVDESDRSRTKASHVTRFSFDDLVTANGVRDPPQRAVSAMRQGVVYLSPRLPSDAEMAFYTMFWRHSEIETRGHDRVRNIGGARKLPLSTWRYETQGLSWFHSKLHGIPCGSTPGVLQPPSCSDPSDASICAGAKCSPNANCIPFDNLPLCICKENFVGDGTLCVDASETAMYPLPTAHELFRENPTECFGNPWPEFVAESSLPTYPGGIAPYAVNTTQQLPAEECFGEICATGFVCREIPPSPDTCIKNGKNKAVYHRFKKSNSKCKEKCRNDRPNNKWKHKGTCPTGICARA